jgi:hypothetical protein
VVKQKKIIGLCLLLGLFESHCHDVGTSTQDKAVLAIKVSSKQLNNPELEEQKMRQLTEAVLNMDLSAIDIAASMQVNAIPELAELLNNEDAAIRTVTVSAIGAIAHPQAHKLLFQALEDDDLNVAGTAIQKIQHQREAIPVEQLVTVLDKIKEPNVLKQLILLLGTRLDTSQVEVLVPFCQKEQDHMVVVACTAAIAKIGIQSYRDNFSQYLLSSQDTQLNTIFSLVGYIDQQWLIAYLQRLLLNKTVIQSLGDAPEPFPKFLRVCDKAVVYIAKLSGVSF